MDNFHYGTTEHGVNSIFCRVAHGVESTISTPNTILNRLQWLYQLSLVWLPVLKDAWQNIFALMIKKGSRWVGCQTKMPKDKKNLADRSTSHQCCKAQQNVPCWISAQHKWLASPSEWFCMTTCALLLNSYHSTILFHYHFWFLRFAVKTKQRKQSKKGMVKNNKLWLIDWRCTCINTKKDTIVLNFIISRQHARDVRIIQGVVDGNFERKIYTL